ncbi:MAG: DUF4157 domain-containing protein [Actinophytocola sp.]|uniref:eCIS core domain-containing protein n=1 Tax=Actinophytocola sp. TaxID=1872138 RepID=UPI00132384F9|nr:DUF4157 domain-containing protein [Actinophytocola sp.]MPZ84785.1 DUF4157 domain-containing protein [Actinophytocola sp.]
MRWPFRRKEDRSESTVDSAVAAPPAAVRRSGRQWTSLPPLPVTVAPTAPLVTGPAPVLAPLPGNRLVFGPPVPARPGRVEGLATPVPPEPVAPVVATPLPPTPEPAPPALTHRPVRAVPTAQAAPLTEAAPQYVGEPREPATPHRAPGWLRYAPTWLTQGEPDPLGLPVSRPVPERPEPKPAPRPVFPPTRLSEGPPAEPESGAKPASAVEPLARVTPALPIERPKRRASLGQSRKLGLGAPIRTAPEQDLVLPPEPPRLEAATPAPTPAPPVERAPTVEQPAEEEAGEEPPLPQPPPQPPPPLSHKRSSPPPPPVRPAAAVAPAPSTVPLVYKGAEGRHERPVPRLRGTTQVPAGLADAIRGRTGIDVSDVPVHRTPGASAEARSLGARAFTRGAEVFLPEEAGSLDAPKARGLLAHELVHVVQQRTLGSSLPAPSTPDGAALEAAAVAAEHEHGGGPAPLLHPSLTQVIGQAARAAGVQLAPLVAEPAISSVTPVEVTSAMPPATPAAPALSEPVRADIGAISEASATRVIEEWTNPLAGGTGFSTGGAAPLPGSPAAEPTPVPTAGSGSGSAAEAEMANQVLQVINLDRAGAGEQPLTTLDEATTAQIRRTVAEQMAARTALSTNRSMMMAAALATSSEPAITGPAPGTPETPAPQAQPVPELLPVPTPAPAPAPVREEDSALRDGQIDLEKIDLDDLSTRLYDRLRSRLRLELLIDRERAGLLTDFR